MTQIIYKNFNYKALGNPSRSGEASKKDRHAEAGEKFSVIIQKQIGGGKRTKAVRNEFCGGSGESEIRKEAQTN